MSARRNRQPLNMNLSLQNFHQSCGALLINEAFAHQVDLGIMTNGQISISALRSETDVEPTEWTSESSFGFWRPFRTRFSKRSQSEISVRYV